MSGRLARRDASHGSSASMGTSGAGVVTSGARTVYQWRKGGLIDHSTRHRLLA